MRRAALALLLTLPAAATVESANLGRLFFTPEQRAQLEYTHARDPLVESDSSSALFVNGIVQKHGGGRTVWINGVAKSAGQSDDRSPDALPIAVPGKTRPVKIKVGQRLQLDKPAENSAPEPAE